MSSIVNYVADGSTTEFQIPFTYISEAHVVVTIDGTATSAFTFLNSSTLQMTTAPTAGSKLQIQRTTPVGALVDFTDGSTLFEGDLDLAHQQNRLIAEESKDIANVAKTTIDNNIADVNTVAGIAADVTNVSARGADVTSVADNMAEVLLADTNAATATTKAAEAVVSANTASAQAVISTTKATESSASAAAALASQNAAQQARTDTDASEALALAYKNSAQTSATTATTKASEASQSATTASSQAATATQKASEASTDAGIALAQAAVATTKAAAASTSESNALSYKDTALAASSASETARAASVVAKDASQVAQTASEAARDAASASETAAATSESNAAASEGVATTQAGISTTKAGEAATSASNAASSASSAQASKDAALAALDSFDDRYLGQKTADPTVDNDGDALVSGALYFNTTDDIMKVYDGSLWVAAYASLSGAMFGANNLSDVADAAGSRANLGLVIGTNVQAFSAILANTTASYTTAEETKLAGIEAGATGDQTASEIRSLVEAATDSNVFTDADHNKLNAIEANAKDDQTITAGSGLSGGGTGNVTLSHSDTSSQGSVNNSGATVVQDVTLDTYGHVTGIGSHTLTLANLGYTGATNANYITNNNQLTNGAGYITSYVNTTYSAGAGLDLSGTTFSVESDLRGEVDQIGSSTSDYIAIGSTTINFVLDGNTDMRLENDGDLHCDGNVIAYSTTVSDERLKTDIVKIDGALDKVDQLNGYTFTYTADGKKSAGVIAQEVQKVLPSAIVESKLPLKMGEDDETEYMTVQYDQLMGLMMEAIKELKAEVAELKGN